MYVVLAQKPHIFIQNVAIKVIKIKDLAIKIYQYMYFQIYNYNLLKFAFSKKATKIDRIFTVDLTLTTFNLKLTVKISSIFVAFL